MVITVRIETTSCAVEIGLDITKRGRMNEKYKTSSRNEIIKISDPTRRSKIGSGSYGVAHLGANTSVASVDGTEVFSILGADTSASIVNGTVLYSLHAGDLYVKIKQPRAIRPKTINW
jgi:hypothetical protein